MCSPISRPTWQLGLPIENTDIKSFLSDNYNSYSNEINYSFVCVQIHNLGASKHCGGNGCHQTAVSNMIKTLLISVGQGYNSCAIKSLCKNDNNNDGLCYKP